jgi:hypothetical protein
MSKRLLLISWVLLPLLSGHAQSDLKVTATGSLDGWLVVTVRSLHYSPVYREVCKNPYADTSAHTITCKKPPAADRSEIQGVGRQLTGWRVLQEDGDPVCRDPEVTLPDKLIACRY